MPHGSIPDALRYAFGQEYEFSYAGLSSADVVNHVARFISGVWQIHPFGEGNTRTTAVFTIQHLRSKGYEVNNEPFRNHSWYFRNTLVRANYEDVTRDIAPTTRYLERFLENQLCGAHHELKNRYLHLDWSHKKASQGFERTDQVIDQVKALFEALGDKEMSATELMSTLGLSHRQTLRQNYMNPALKANLIERTIRDKPTSGLQKYRKASRT